MSSRVLRKLHGDKELVSIIGIDGMSESDDGINQVGGDGVTKPLANNRFELLNNVEHSLSDTEAKEDDDRENDPPQEDQEKKKLEKQDSTHSTDSLKRKKKKKKKKLKSQKSTEENLDDAEDEVDASIREVNKMLGERESSSADATCTASTVEGPSPERSLLAVDPRNFNPDNEMKRIFGSKVIQNEQTGKQRRGRGRTHGRSSILVSPKNWPPVGKPGISMSLVERKEDVSYFMFEHSKQFQTVQQQFLEAVESFNPDNIVDLLNLYPYHIDALIQFSDVCKMGEDMQMAAELIERALYCLESCCHPLFSFVQGNCRLDYRRAENRSFFIALFKHIMFVGERGCTRTALEFCKFLLSLDVDGDPLCITLMLDYYALRCSQYDYLLKMFSEWNAERNLSQLPNFAFSVPLAMYFKALNENKSTDEADLMLQDSLIMFPGFLMPLLDKCCVQPDAEVLSSSFFNVRTKSSDSPALAQLLALYVGRTHMVWKAADVILWLETNVRKVLERVKNDDPYIKECAEKRKLRYKGTPRNVLRHIILSNIKEANVMLPQDLTQSPIFMFDPLPPIDAITTYTRPLRPSPTENRGALSMFFRSLLPDFNAPHDVVGAAAERSDTNDLRRSVTSLLDAMRDLLSNIELADVPNEGDVDSDEDHRQ